MATIDTSYMDDEISKRLLKLERKLKRIYRQAGKELGEKYNQYLQGWDEEVDGEIVHHKGLVERYEEQYKAYQEGAYTKQEFEQWFQAQVGRGQRWESLQADMADRLTRANKEASAFINDDLPYVYTSAYNFAAFKVESTKVAASFNVVSEDVVRQLSTEDKIRLPKTRIKIAKDVAWNKKKLQGALLQGILQGDSVHDIAKRFQQVTNMNQVSAIRNARTSYTGAQNRGKQDVFDRCEDQGIELKKKWISAHDGRTRESHRHLDGVIVPNKDKFPNGLMYPGDMSGAPAELYNCRCAMIAVIPGINDEGESENTVESYNKWLMSKVLYDDEYGSTFSKLYVMAYDAMLIPDKLQEIDEDKYKSFLSGLDTAMPIVEDILEKELKTTKFIKTIGKNSYYGKIRKIVAITSNTKPSSIAHELFHRIDAREQFWSKIKEQYDEDLENLRKKAGEGGIDKYIKRRYKDRLTKNGKKLIKKYSAIGDILNGMTDGDVDVGGNHPDNYWEIEGTKLKETVAQFGKIMYDNDEETVEMFMELFPSIYEKITSLIIGG